jgi:hypothetical protein
VTLDGGLVLRGAGYALCWLVPAAALNYLAAQSDSVVFVFLTFLLVLLGFAFGGYAVARNPTDTPLQHAAAAALLAYAVVQGVGVVISLVGDDEISVLGIVFTAMLAICTGMLGAVLAKRQPSV